jgi:hypothetical protein
MLAAGAGGDGGGAWWEDGVVLLLFIGLDGWMIFISSMIDMRVSRLFFPPVLCFFVFLCMFQVTTCRHFTIKPMQS